MDVTTTLPAPTVERSARHERSGARPPAASRRHDRDVSRCPIAVVEMPPAVRQAHRRCCVAAWRRMMPMAVLKRRSRRAAPIAMLAPRWPTDLAPIAVLTDAARIVPAPMAVLPKPSAVELVPIGDAVDAARSAAALPIAKLAIVHDARRRAVPNRCSSEVSATPLARGIPAEGRRCRCRHSRRPTAEPNACPARNAAFPGIPHHAGAGTAGAGMAPTPRYATCGRTRHPRDQG